MTTTDAYPVSLAIAYPEEPRDRLRAFFRAILAIPIVIVQWLLTSYANGFVVTTTLLMILFRRKYPRWWFEWNVQLLRFETRVFTYVFLLGDTYPATDDEQQVDLRVAYPNAEEELNRWLPLIKWLLALPHYIVLAFLWLAVVVVTVIAWFAILFTGRYPRGLFDFVVGVDRWTLRVVAYAFLLTTDAYPPFRLE